VQHKSIAIVGFGDLGTRVSRRLRGPWRSIGLRRNAAKVPAGVRGVAVDLGEPESLQVLSSLAPDALMVALSPAERSVAGYEAGFSRAMEGIVAGLGSHVPEQAFFISSTRVYAEAEGAWVDEDSPLAMEDPYARAIIDAEQCFLDALPRATVLRAGGLYGHGPGPLLRAVAAGRLNPREPLRYGNRIHREDVAEFITYALEHPLTERVINLVDDACVSVQEIERWLCEELRLPYSVPEAADTPRRGHKRIRNERLHDTGFTLKYPDYRSGYREVLGDWTAHSEREDGLDLH